MSPFGSDPRFHLFSQKNLTVPKKKNWKCQQGVAFFFHFIQSYNLRLLLKRFKVLGDFFLQRCKRNDWKKKNTSWKSRSSAPPRRLLWCPVCSLSYLYHIIYSSLSLYTIYTVKNLKKNSFSYCLYVYMQFVNFDLFFLSIDGIKFLNVSMCSRCHMCTCKH